MQKIALFPIIIQFLLIDKFSTKINKARLFIIILASLSAEDVFVTGFAAQRCNLTRKRLAGVRSLRRMEEEGEPLDIGDGRAMRRVSVVHYAEWGHKLRMMKALTTEKGDDKD